MRTALEPDRLRDVYDRAARRYDRQHALLTAGSDARGRRLVVAETVRPGDLVLDAGAGTGSSALLAAERAGPRGRVVLLDLSRGMLDEAALKGRRAGLGDRLAIVAGDLLRLPFADAAFDAVISTYSMCPLFDPVTGAREIWRVLKPGGRAGFAHSTEPRHPLVRALADAVEDVAWKLPGVSLGCRPVSVAPTLQAEGGRLLYTRTLGVPLWPLRIVVLEKPTAA
jgi:ubiquinone/menaquinone biosynthesis C-methylase UbiE